MEFNNCKTDHCLIGFLDFGFQPRNLTALDYKELMERDPYFTKKYFLKFNFCPICGRKIKDDFN